MKIKRSEITEETRYVWECPKCGYYNETPDDPNYEESVFCENEECSTDFKLIDGEGE